MNFIYFSINPKFLKTYSFIIKFEISLLKYEQIKIPKKKHQIN